MSNVSDCTPLVTINILSYNRKDELQNTLNKVFSQNYSNIEVIVVDNASTDKSVEMVRSEFPNVAVISLEENIGITGWNEGFKAATGEYILCLDDDSYPVDDCIKKAVDFLWNNGNKSILALNIYNNASSYCESSGMERSSPLISFIGCGVIIPKNILKILGGFNSSLFLYEHEVEFSIRAYDKGFNVLYNRECKVIHVSSQFNRTSARRKYYVTRNILIILTLYFDARKVVFRILRIMVGRILSGFKQGDLSTIIMAVTSYLLRLPRLIRKRKPVKRTIQSIYGYGNFAGGYHFNDKEWYN